MNIKNYVKILIALVSVLTLFSIQCQKNQESQFSWIHEGDLIFQRRGELRYRMMDFLQSSYYNHCGIIVKDDGKYKVLSAELTVRTMDLKEWLAKGENRHFLILRPQKEVLSNISKVVKKAKFYFGRVYDYSYDWDDKKIYNTELIQKSFWAGAGIYLGAPKYVDMFYIAPEDTTLFEEIKDKLPLNKEVVTVESIINSNHLKNILKN